jgi:hypothetical protein
MYHDNDYITVTQKLHGTSGRFGNILVRKQLNLFERLLQKLGVKIQDKEYDYIAGSRRVVKDVKT